MLALMQYRSAKGLRGVAAVRDGGQPMSVPGTLSYSEGVRTRGADLFEISAPPFTLPVRNPIGRMLTPDFTIGAL